MEADRSFYDSTVAPHHHFYNPETGEHTDIPADKLQIIELPEPPPVTETVAVEVTVILRNRVLA